MDIKKLLSIIDYKLLVPVIAIYGLSFLTIFSTAPSLYLDHLIYFGIGLIVFFLISYIDYPIYLKYWFHLYVLVILLLILTYILGHTALGAIRWLRIGEYTIQPSEISKIVVAIMAGKILISEKLAFPRLGFFPPHLPFKIYPQIIKFFANKFVLYSLLFAPIFILVVAQPDLGTSLSIMFLFIVSLIFSSFDKRIILIILIMMGIMSQPLWNILKPYQKERVLVFINPEKDRYGSGYNSIQATIAVGSGGIWGKGFQKGTQTQLNFLPIYWTDFLVATFAEERGLVGLLFILVIYSFFIFYSLSLIRKIQIPELKMLGITAVSYFFFQFTINFGMNIGIFPVTGIPFPFFSYGGTSLITSFIFLAFLNKISMELK